MTIYPGSIDTNTSLPLVIDDVTPVTAITVNRLRETLIAVETELGTDPSGGYSDVAARLTALEASGGASHATTHEDGGLDELTIQNLGSGAAAANKVVVTDGAGGLTLQDYSSGVSGSGTDRNIATWDAAGTGLRDNPIAIDSAGDIQWPAETGLSPERRIVIANATVDAQKGTSLYLEAGDGAASTSTTGGAGGGIQLPAGNAGATSSASHFGGTGGNATMGGGTGGTTNNATLRGGTGGWCSLSGGTGGGSTGSGRGGTGGQFLAAGGYGGDASGTGVGGPGGSTEIEGGRGGYGPAGTGGAGGDCIVKGGEGHIDGATVGGDLLLYGGEGFPYFAGGAGTGGNVEIEGGPVSGDGAGGNVAINGGAGGTTNGTVNVGLSNTSAVNIGAISTPTTIYSATTTIEDPGANSYLDFASSEYVIGRTRYIRTVSPITAGYRGDSLTIEAGDGADGGASGGQGGNAGFYSGDGGEAATAGNTSSAGGSLTIQSGYGGDGNTSGGKPHWGGTISINAGRGGYIQAGSTINPTFSKGGAINILAGDGCTSFEPTVAATIGGALTMEGGEGGLGYNATGDGGPGGTTTIQGGRSGQAAGSGNDGAGGSVQIDAGRNYSGAQGTVDLGYTDRWGASWASAVRCYVPFTFPNLSNATIRVDATTTPSTSGKYLDVYAGTGGDSATATKGGAGGRTSIYAGAGGENTSTGDGGTGGSARLIGGDGGSAASGTPGKGGNAYVFGGYSEDTGGDTYIDAGFGDVTLGALYVGQNARLIEIGLDTTGSPVTIFGELYIDDGGSSSAAFLDMVDGASAPVSAAGHVRLRSNAGTFEVSENGGAWAAPGGGGITGSGTDNHIVRWDGTGAVQDSGWYIDDTNNLWALATGGFGSRKVTVDQAAADTAGKGLMLSAGEAGAMAGATSRTGGTFDVYGGVGGESASATKASTGGRTTIYGGDGGDNTSTGDGGDGGDARLIPGSGGSGATQGDGGDAWVVGGYGDQGGDVRMQGGWGTGAGDGFIIMGDAVTQAIYMGSSSCPIELRGDTYIWDPSTANTAFLDFTDGESSAVSASGHGRIVYNESTNKFEISENGGNYYPLGYVDTGAAKTGAYNANIGELVKVDPSGGGFAVTLPTAVGYANQGITIKNVTNSTNAVTFNTTSGQTMDGAASGADQIDTAYETVTFISDGSNWMRFPAA